VRQNLQILLNENGVRSIHLVRDVSRERTVCRVDRVVPVGRVVPQLRETERLPSGFSGGTRRSMGCMGRGRARFRPEPSTSGNYERLIGIGRGRARVSFPSDAQLATPMRAPHRLEPYICEIVPPQLVPADDHNHQSYSSDDDVN